MDGKQSNVYYPTLGIDCTEKTLEMQDLCLSLSLWELGGTSPFLLEDFGSIVGLKISLKLRLLCQPSPISIQSLTKWPMSVLVSADQVIGSFCPCCLLFATRRRPSYSSSISPSAPRFRGVVKSGHCRECFQESCVWNGSTICNASLTQL